MAKLNVTDPCPYCKTKSLVQQLVPKEENMSHKARIYCAACNKFIRWVSKSELNGVPQRLKTRRRKNIDYCEICLRKDVIIEEHHILPFKHYPDLDDDKRNRLVVCADCHGIIHCIRRLAGTDNNKG